MSQGPLEALEKRLDKYRIPSLAILLARFNSLEEFEEFLRIVRELLPERERDILANPEPRQQISAFVSYFADRYFPLEEGLQFDNEGDYALLTRFIPVIPRGLGAEEYHQELPSDNIKPGLQLMAYLVECPYAVEEDVRIPLAEACEEHVPRELLQRVPRDGYSLEELRRRLDGTEYSPAGLWAAIIWHETGNIFLDIDFESEGYLWEAPEWSKEVADDLTLQWQQADRIDEEVINFANWLEEDPPARFEEIIDFIERRANANK